jgi:Transposase domain (DUF772)
MKSDAEKKPVIERVAELAMRLGGKHLADYGSTRSRHDFTQRQLMACLILRVYLKTTYRGVLELLAVSPNLREALGMEDKLPHYTTLQKFSARSQVYADAGYDAEWGAESVIKPAKQRADGTRSGFWRSRMSEKYLERKGYGARWAVESLFSALKRTMGSTLTSRKPGQLLAEAAFKVLAYTLRR